MVIWASTICDSTALCFWESFRDPWPSRSPTDLSEQHSSKTIKMQKACDHITVRDSKDPGFMLSFRFSV